MTRKVVRPAFISVPDSRPPLGELEEAVEPALRGRWGDLAPRYLGCLGFHPGHFPLRARPRPTPCWAPVPPRSLLPGEGASVTGFLRALTALSAAGEKRLTMMVRMTLTTIIDAIGM